MEKRIALNRVKRVGHCLVFLFPCENNLSIDIVPEVRGIFPAKTFRRRIYINSLQHLFKNRFVPRFLIRHSIEKIPDLFGFGIEGSLVIEHLAIFLDPDRKLKDVAGIKDIHTCLLYGVWVVSNPVQTCKTNEHLNNSTRCINWQWSSWLNFSKNHHSRPNPIFSEKSPMRFRMLQNCRIGRDRPY